MKKWDIQETQLMVMKMPIHNDQITQMLNTAATNSHLLSCCPWEDQ